MKNILITGASTGIGYAATKYLIEQGYFVFGSVRKVEDAKRLEDIFKPNFKALLFDVRDYEAILKSVPIVEKRLGKAGLAGLVNNAGIAVYGPIKHLPIADWEKQMDVNVNGIIRVTQAFLPLLGADKDRAIAAGKIINISSVSALFTTPILTPYSASKKAVEAISEGLRRELLIYGIDVVSILPGPIKTPIWDKTDLEKNNFPNTDYEEIMKGMSKFVKQAEGRALPPEKLAKLIYGVLIGKKRKTKYVITANPWPMRIMKILPARWIDKIFLKQFKKSQKL